MTTPPEPPPEPPPGPSSAEAMRCSAKGCRATAQWGLVWNNPRLHAAQRRKVWLACSDHREHLASFLAARSFLREVVPVAQLPAGGAG